MLYIQRETSANTADAFRYRFHIEIRFKKGAKGDGSEGRKEEEKGGRQQVGVKTSKPMVREKKRF